jgi:CRP-like cAMP-binding protein
MDRLAKERVLKQSPLFGGFSLDLLRAIGGLCEQATHPPGVELFEAGSPADHLFILEQGNVALVIRSEAREEVILATLHTPGDVLAWSALVEPRVLTAGALCLEETRLLRLEARKLEDLLDQHPAEGLAFMRRLTSLIAHRLKDTQRRLIGSIS